MQIDGINTSMANVANTGSVSAKTQAGDTMNVNDSFKKDNDTAWKNFQLDQKISVLQQQIASDKSKAKLYSIVTKGLVALSVATILGGGAFATAIGSPLLCLAFIGVGTGSMILGGKAYRNSEGLEIRAMSGESKATLYEMEKMGNNLGIELEKMGNSPRVEK